MAERLCSSIAYDTFAVLLLDDVGTALEPLYAWGLPAEVASWRFGLGQGLEGLVARDGVSIIANDARGDHRYLATQAEVRAQAVLPLAAKHGVSGVLVVGSHTTNFFTPDRCRLLELLAGQLASAIENGRLWANLRRHTQTLAVLQETSRELTAILDRELLLQRVAERVRQLIAYDVFNVMRWDEVAHQLESTFTVRLLPGSSRKTTLKLGEGICGTVAALHQPVRVPNVHRDPRYADCGDPAIRSELAVPLLFKERLLGVLNLESTALDAFSQGDEQLLATLASFVAIALENSILYARLRADERQLAEDLAAARELQKLLLPRTTPWVPGLQIAFAYTPARHLGGDLYDVLSYDDGRTLVTVGDVAGKGTAAALYGALAAGMLRGYVTEHRCSPVCLLTYLNEELKRRALERRFLALGVLLCDPGQRRVVVANAGLPYPLLFRRGEVREIALPSLPIGSLASVVYEEVCLDLEPGDVVVLASDGIREAGNSQGQPFGDDGLEAVLRHLASASASARELADGILTASDRHLDGVLPADDRTVAVLRFN